MPNFSIIYGRKDEPKEQWTTYNHGLGWSREQGRYLNQTEWDNPQAPNELVKSLNAAAKTYNTPICYMLQRLPDPVDFLTREVSRADYRPFEVQGEDYHCAELQGDKISYYATKYDAYDDKRSTRRLGRYLREFTTKDDNEIAEICARLGVDSGDGILKFASTRNEIKHVYENGPRSCMSQRGVDFNAAGIHPAEAYAAGDISIAYLERDGRITARCVCVPETKKYAPSVYGDYVRLKAMLDDAGWTVGDWSFLRGCKMLKLDIGNNRYAVPYIDSGDGLDTHEDGIHLVLVAHGCCPDEAGWITHDMERPDEYEYDDGYYDDDYCNDPDCDICNP
jgi:hypothetical protein